MGCGESSNEYTALVNDDVDDDFLSSTAGIPDNIGDDPIEPLQVPGMPEPIDPSRPWQSINVEVYLPLAMLLLEQAFKIPAKKEPSWQLEKWELEALENPLKEAVQKALYDLKLASVAGNPYVALVIAVGTLAGVKYAAIKAMRMMKEKEQRELELNQRPHSRPLTPPESSTENTRTQESEGASSSAGYQMPESPFFYDNGSGEGDA